jgi:hypothetical protein
MINMHYGTLLGTPCLSGEPCATNNTGAPAASYTVSSSVGADGTSVTLTSVTGIQQYELLSILEADGVYRSNTAFSISGNTVTLGRPSVAGIATGTNVFEFYQNKNHPWTQGFYAIADDWVYGNALTPPRELLQSFTNLYNVQPFTLYYSTAASSVGVGPYEPATTAHPALGLTPESGGISMSLPLGSLPKGQYMVEVVAAKTGNASAVTFGVIYADGYGTSAVGIGQYDQTLHSATFTFPGRDQQVILWISTTTGTADTLIIGYINVYRITGQAAPLSTYRKIVPLGDSWYANTPGIAARLATTLPNATIVNKGVGGNTLNQMALRFWTDVAPQNPDLVITLGGTNDFYAGESAALVDFYERQIASYASSIGAASIAVNSSVGEDSGTHLELSRQYAEGVYTSRGTLPSGSTSTYCSVSGTLTSGHLIKADASSNCVDGGAALQKSDFRGYWTGMLVGGASAGATQWRNLIVKGITITRMSIAMPETGANCTVADIARLSDGTTNVDLSVPNGITTSDSGALAQNYAAGSTLTLSLVLGTCTTHSSKTNVTVEYVMQ